MDCVPEVESLDEPTSVLMEDTDADYLPAVQLASLYPLNAPGRLEEPGSDRVGLT